jgi:hypothetical protein
MGYNVPASTCRASEVFFGVVLVILAIDLIVVLANMDPFDFVANSVELLRNENQSISVICIFISLRGELPDGPG